MLPKPSVFCKNVVWKEAGVGPFYVNENLYVLSAYLIYLKPMKLYEAKYQLK